MMFKGPLGIWPYPLVNLIMSITDRLKIRSRKSDKGMALKKTSITEIKRTADGWTILEHQQ